ncbi:NO-inducible flavohemoprotein [Halobacillus salinarum]|uniref:Flavohemoprotein n=1 Tax=Halobacillus salinarum TaxID=2932257 RepID=A0ABY4EK14_9BACI|nr:NO-inducible flavohemoprotein [Halobacillus salinarum]UOQ44775.1 NO-inducible flavohemoprotein [Halobacillus salinarum]
MSTQTKETLNKQTVDMVKATIPLLQSHGETITRCFYKNMFESHPELKNMFNQTNQRAGKQPKALANAVLAAAVHIENLEAITPVVRQIAQKHRSLQVKPEQYPIVGQHLLGAIKEVLGDVATEDVLQAWAEAYGAIANVFIEVEREMYSEARDQLGGWEGYRKFKVVRKEEESREITSFYLQPADEEAFAAFKPGQYITVRADIPGEAYTHVRQYSLSGNPDKDYYRISVKREEAKDKGEAGKVSMWLHTAVQAGDVIELTAPAGEFVFNPSSSQPVVFISGGVGLTPLVSMLHGVRKLQPERKVTYIHAARNGSVHALKEEMYVPGVNTHVIYSEPSEKDRELGNFEKEGYLDLSWLKQVAQKDAEFYFCGPAGFMKTVYQSLKAWGVSDEQLHYEFFGPAAQLDG